MRHHSAAPSVASGGGAEQRAGAHQSVVEREADPVVAGVDPQEGDLAEVDGEDAVLGLDVVPAALLELLAEVLQLVVGEPDRDDLAALEADLDPLRVSHQCPPAGSTISVSTPPVERGWRKATRLSRMPTRGSAVDQLDPGGRELLQRRVDVVDRVGDVVQARALAGEELADRRCRARAAPAARRGPSPTSSRTASTPCDSTVSRCASSISKLFS